MNLEVALPSQVADDDRLRSSPSAHLHYFLGSGGLRVGNDRVGALLKLTAGWLHFEPLLLGSRRDLSGPVAIPAAGLDVRF